jgi:O-antigen/teichoic acid export membrane protein
MGRDERHYIKNSLITFLSKIGVLVLLVGINAIIGRALGPRGKGLVSLLSLVGGFVAALTTFGFEYANVYFLGKDRSLRSFILAQNLVLTASVTLILLPLLIYLGKWLAPYVLRALPLRFWFYAILTVPFLMIVRLSLTYFQGLEDFISFNLLEILRFFCYLLLAVLILVLLKRRHDKGAVELVVSQAIFGSLVGISLILRRRELPGRVDRGLVKRSFSLGIRAHIGQVLQFFNYRLDLFLVNFFRDVSDVGLYAASVGIGELLWHLPVALSLTLFPRTASLKVEESGRFSAKVLRVSFVIILVGGIFLILLGGFLLELIYGGRFRNAYPALVLLIPGIISFSMAKIAIGYLHGRGKPLYGTYLTLFSLIFTVIFDILLIPPMGIEGAALASSIVYTMGGILAVTWFKRESGLSIRDILVINGDDVSTLIRGGRDLYRALIQNLRWGRPQ